MKLHTTTMGEGPKTAAAVHGLSSDGESWSEFASWLADQGYRVILVDQRGHGLSDRADSYLVEDLADDLVETLPVGLDLLLGESLGGRAILAAVERLRPLKAVYLDPGWTVPADFAFAVPVDEQGVIAPVEGIRPMLPGFSDAHLATVRRAWELFDPAWYTAPNPVLPDLQPHVPPVVPSLVVLADPSACVSTALQQSLAPAGYEVHVVPGGQHTLRVVNFEETKAALRGWV